jgi:SAM-dependent methyltransferase
VSFNDGWLALIHESHGMPDNRRRYMHRFVWYDAIGRLCRYSPAFYLHSLGIEFSAGLAKHPTRPEIIASFGVHDKTSWLASFDENEIKKILKSADLVSDKMSFDLDTISWLSQQTNRALMDKSSVSTSIDILKKALLPLHTDAPKNWDNLIGLWHTVLNIDPHDAVMDVAATPESAFLPSLSAMGYKNLISINLTQNKTEIINGVTYMHGDCTQTQFSDGYFGFISCLSVIEHGVDLDKFFAESSRILKSGGYLFISTDYWFDSVDTRGQTAFGAPVKVFSARDIHELAKIAEKHNLHITGQIDLTCNQKVVNWIGMDYTFINILFVKK